jgi:hypothetical protein
VFKTSLTIPLWSQSLKDEIKVSIYDCDDDTGTKITASDLMGDTLWTSAELLALTTSPSTALPLLKDGKANKDASMRLCPPGTEPKSSLTTTTTSETKRDVPDTKLVDGQTTAATAATAATTGAVTTSTDSKTDAAPPTPVHHAATPSATTSPPPPVVTNTATTPTTTTASVVSPTPATSTSSTGAPLARVKVGINAGVRNLKKGDIFSASDPVVRAWVDGQLVAQTEWTKNVINYDFRREMNIPLIPGVNSELKFCVFDIDTEGKQPTDADLLGQAVIGSLTLLTEVSIHVPLLKPGAAPGSASVGTLILYGADAVVQEEAKRAGKGELIRRSLIAVGSKLVKMDLIGKSDPIAIASQKRAGNWIEIGRTEVIKYVLVFFFLSTLSLRVLWCHSSSCNVMIIGIVMMLFGRLHSYFHYGHNH